MTGLDITLLRPFWLLALPVLAGLAWWLYVKKGNIGDWQRAADPELLNAMAALGRIEGAASRLPVGAALLTAAITVLALAGPAVERRDSLSFRNLDGVLFLVDASSSVTDSPRWVQMQTLGRFGLAALGTRPGGLIVFGGDAYVATDMTVDHTQLGQTFSLIDAKTVPDPGSRPERALALARDLLRSAEVLAGDIILLSDGAGLGPDTLREVAAIAGQGTRVSFVSLDDPTPEILSHAAVGGGQVFTLEDVTALPEWLSQDARDRLEKQDYPLLFWKDMGRYLLALALLPLFMLFRRHVA